jgi:hypothetical protein
MKKDYICVCIKQMVLSLTPEQQKAVEAMNKHIGEYVSLIPRILTKAHEYCSKLGIMSGKIPCMKRANYDLINKQKNVYKIEDFYFNKANSYEQKIISYDQFVNAFNDFSTYANANFGGSKA